jgi:hypothetical protein
MRAFSGIILSVLLWSQPLQVLATADNAVSAFNARKEPFHARFLRNLRGC